MELSQVVHLSWVLGSHTGDSGIRGEVRLDGREIADHSPAVAQGLFATSPMLPLPLLFTSGFLSLGRAGRKPLMDVP